MVKVKVSLPLILSSNQIFFSFFSLHPGIANLRGNHPG